MRVLPTRKEKAAMSILRKIHTPAIELEGQITRLYRGHRAEMLELDKTYALAMSPELAKNVKEHFASGDHVIAELQPGARGSLKALVLVWRKGYV
jgi:hypothetical protein